MNSLIFLFYSFFTISLFVFSFGLVVSICRSLNIIRRWIKLYTPHLIHNCTYTLILRFECWRSDSDSESDSDCDALYLCLLIHCSMFYVNDANDSIFVMLSLYSCTAVLHIVWRLDTMCGAVFCIWHVFGTLHILLNNILSMLFNALIISWINRIILSVEWSFSVTKQIESILKWYELCKLFIYRISFLILTSTHSW